MASRFIAPVYDVGSGISPASGAKLFFFETDGTTLKDTYKQAAATVANANPVIADSTGLFPDIYISGAYKITLQDKNGSQIYGLKDIIEVLSSGTGFISTKTLAEAVADTTAEEGDVVIISDRGDALFEYETGQTPNTIDIVAADAAGVDLVLHKSNKASQYGITGTGDSAIIDRVITKEKNVLIDDNCDIEAEITKAGVHFSVTSMQPYKVAVPSVAATPAFNVSATGGTTREKVRFEHIDFEGGSGTCIKANATNPLELYDIRFDTGKAALDLTTFFYGSARDCIFLKSGATLNNVNNFDFVGTDANGNNAVSSGRFLATEYAFELTDCVGVQFSEMTFEAWDCNVINLLRCKAISFNRAWFEANDSERALLLVDCANVSFNDGGQIDTTFAQPSDSFIQVANTFPADSREVRTAITFNTTDLVLRESPTASVNFVKTSDVAGAGKAFVGFNDCSLISGFIHNPNLNTFMEVRRMMLTSPTNTTDTKKGFTSVDTVDVSEGKNSSWTPNNANTQWDFTTGVGGWAETPSVGSTVSVVATMPASAPLLTGTGALKVATTGAVTSRMQMSMSDAGAVTLAGQTYFLACKVWSNVTCTAKLRLLDNADTPVDDSTTVNIGGTGWRWLVMKTNSANMAGILASGLDPVLRVDFITTAATDIYMDRADFQIDNGDHYLP